MKNKNSLPSQIATILSGVLAAFGVGALLARLARKLEGGRGVTVGPGSGLPGTGLMTLGEEGLSEEEAARRSSNRRFEESKKLSRRRLKHTLRRSTFSVFNLTMLVLAFTLLWLDDPLGALSTLGVLLLNIAINTFQQIFAARMVEKAALEARAYAMVIRSGKLKSVDLNKVVVGDVLAAGQGDVILADGVLLAAHNLELVNPSDPENILTVEEGGEIQVGSVCLRGEAVYRIDDIPPVQTFDILEDEEDEAASQAKRQEGKEKPRVVNRRTDHRRIDRRTPLERILQRILIFLLSICVFFYLTLLLQLLRIDVLTPDMEKIYRDVMSIVFSLSPAGFFLIVVVNYAMGTIDLARQGALVRDNRSVELIAQLNTLIAIRSQGLTEIRAKLEMIPGETGEPVLAENFVRRILGDLARSVPTQHDYARILERSFEGEKIALADAAFFPTIFHWAAVSITSAERRGTFVIGTVEALKPYLHRQRKRRIRKVKEDEGEREQTARTNPVRGWLERIQNLGKRNQPSGKDEQGSDEPESPPPGNEGNLAPEAQGDESEVEAIPALVETGDLPEEEPAPKGLTGFFKRTANRVTRLIEQVQDIPQPLQSGDEDLETLVLAYHPEPYRLYPRNKHLPDQRPSIPTNLQPVCYIHFSHSLQPGLVEMIERFIAGDVRTRFFTEWYSDEMMEVVRKAGLVGSEDVSSALLTSAQLAETSGRQPALTDEEGKEPQKSGSEETTSIAIQQAIFFLGLTPPQKNLVVDALRKQREYVGVIGSSISDWNAMNRANISIAPKSSDQAMITNAHVVLTKENPPPLITVLERSQQIVHSTLDVIKLNMVPIFYILLVMGFMLLSKGHLFVYNSTQGGMIAFFTVVIPSVAVSFWARKGSIHVETMAKELIVFILPPAVIISVMVIALSFVFQLMGYNLVELQNANTHFLISAGLLVALFVKPPVGWLAGGASVSLRKGKGDFRMAYTVVGVWAVFNLVILIPLAQDLMKIKPLDSALAYGVVLAAAFASGVLMQLVWRGLRWLG